MTHSAREYTADALFAVADVLADLAIQMQELAHGLLEQVWLQDTQLSLPGILPVGEEVTRLRLETLLARAVYSACPKNSASS